MYFSINGHWETINSLHDISRIVREYYNPELANELDNLIEFQEDEIKRLEESIDYIELEAAYDVDYLADEINDLEYENSKLRERIKELEVS